jgi:hypothetical protein
MKIRPLGAKLLHADRRTDLTKLIVTFRNFAKAPKNGYLGYFKVFEVFVAISVIVSRRSLSLCVSQLRSEVAMNALLMGVSSVSGKCGLHCCSLLLPRLSLSK